MSRHLLIDADVVLYQCAAKVEVATDWGNGFWTWHTDEEATKRAVFDQIDEMMEALSASSYALCITDSEGNFRKSVLPSYKSNRSSQKRPMILKHLREWLVDEHDAYFRPGLEGDDCMGILATCKGQKGVDRIIVSIDKDMKTIPGLYCRDIENGVVEVSVEEADRWHLIQALAGDTTDGYTGCPGIGMERAEKALTDMTRLEPYEHVMSRGPRKGEVEVRHNEVPTDDPWEVVVSRYVAAGLNEAEALVQARVARILRASDYNFKKKEPILWTPRKV